ncbi:MAG TPA: hypothetical protein VNV25_10435 [Gemmatimonadaceae bacterium]|jgi:hypothetical protein|nr:hypothetical protein [Gemmatimonadaceae bacterium]
MNCRLLVCSFLFTAPVLAQPAHEPLGDAWWTGPMLAPSAGTLPPGHWLVEPYVYDIKTAHADNYGSRAYVIYGLLDRFSVGVIPILGLNDGIGLGDLTAQAQYRLTQFQPGSWVPTMSIVAQETFPTGTYDRLGTNTSNALGAGAYATTLGFYSQTCFWMPNGRILRARLDLSQVVYSTKVHVDDVSVYGTGPGFLGRALPGLSSSADLAAEYSATQRWVLALDAAYGWNGDTRVEGDNVQLHSGWSESLALAPAVEYNMSSRIGVLLGVRFIDIGRNTTHSVSPALAVNMVY